MEFYGFWLGWRKTRWWFQIFFIFTPKLGEDEPNLTCAYFSDGLVFSPPTRKVMDVGSLLMGTLDQETFLTDGCPMSGAVGPVLHSTKVFQGPARTWEPLPILFPYHSHKNGTLKIWEWYGKLVWVPLTIRGSHVLGGP